MPTTTSLMGLTVPQLNDSSPAYVDAIAASLAVLDYHNHASGGGAKVPVAGLNINAALPFQGHSATGLRSMQMAVQASLLSATADNTSLFVHGTDLYFLDGNNVPVRLTDSGSVAAGAGGGGIEGDYVAFGAHVIYDAEGSSSPQYYFEDHLGTSAPIECGGLWIDDTTNVPGGGLLRLCNVASSVMEGRSLPLGSRGFMYYDYVNDRIRAYVGGVWTTVQVV
jgi:hypothetical protein